MPSHSTFISGAASFDPSVGTGSPLPGWPVVPVLRRTVLVNAPSRTVAAALRDIALLRETVAAGGHPVQVPDRPGGLLGPGDELSFTVRVAPGLRIPVRTQVVEVDHTRILSALVAGVSSALRHETTLTPSLAGTLMTDALQWTAPLGPLGVLADLLLLRRLVLAALAVRAARVREHAEYLAAHAEVVTAAVVVRGGRLLAQQRSWPASAAGRWELPGGRVEAGESELIALVRECREELAVEVAVGGRIGPDVPLPGNRLLRAYAACLVDAAEPRPVEHAALRWLAVDELDRHDWLDADRALLPDLARLLEKARPRGPGEQEVRSGGLEG